MGIYHKLNCMRNDANRTIFSRVLFPPVFFNPNYCTKCCWSAHGNDPNGHKTMCWRLLHFKQRKYIHVLHLNDNKLVISLWPNGNSWNICPKIDMAGSLLFQKPFIWYANEHRTVLVSFAYRAISSHFHFICIRFPKVSGRGTPSSKTNK